MLSFETNLAVSTQSVIIWLDVRVEEKTAERKELASLLSSVQWTRKNGSLNFITIKARNLVWEFIYLTYCKYRKGEKAKLWIDFKMPLIPTIMLVIQDWSYSQRACDFTNFIFFNYYNVYGQRHKFKV